MNKANRLQYLRARAVALRLSSFASLGAPSALQASPSPSPSVSTSAFPSPSPSLAPSRSIHVWRKSGKGEIEGQSEALPLGFTPSPVLPFSPVLSLAERQLTEEESAECAVWRALFDGLIAPDPFANPPLLLTWQA